MHSLLILIFPVETADALSYVESTMMKFDWETLPRVETLEPCWCTEMVSIPMDICSCCNGNREKTCPGIAMDWWEIGGRFDGEITGTSIPVLEPPHVPWWKIVWRMPEAPPKPIEPASVVLDRNICRVADIPRDFIPCHIVLPGGSSCNDFEFDDQNWLECWRVISKQFSEHKAVAIDTHF